jgi:hypothetical protein
MSYHFIPFHIISYHLISFHIISLFSKVAIIMAYSINIYILKPVLLPFPSFLILIPFPEYWIAPQSRCLNQWGLGTRSMASYGSISWIWCAGRTRFAISQWFRGCSWMIWRKTCVFHSKTEDFPKNNMDFHCKILHCRSEDMWRLGLSMWPCSIVRRGWVRVLINYPW